MEGENEEVLLKSFEELGVCKELAEACDSLGWKNPSKIQCEAIPHALEGKDLIGLAKTGSGKTGAFALPILQALLEVPHAFFACVLSPTRELAIQISEQFEALGSGIGVKCAVLVGGVDQVQQSIAIGKRPHIIVATPGHLVDHLSNTKGFSLRTLKYLVLDEADRLLNEDFEKAIDEILSVIPRERRTYLFSATMTKKVEKLKKACLRNPVKIEASTKYSTVDTLKQQFRFIPAKYKDCYLIYILSEMSGSTSMVFTRTCDSTRFLALILRNLGFRAVPISGQMSQPKKSKKAASRSLVDEEPVPRLRGDFSFLTSKSAGVDLALAIGEVLALINMDFTRRDDPTTMAGQGLVMRSEVKDLVGLANSLLDSEAMGQAGLCASEFSSMLNSLASRAGRAELEIHDMKNNLRSSEEETDVLKAKLESLDSDHKKKYSELAESFAAVKNQRDQYSGQVEALGREMKAVEKAQAEL